MGKPLGKTKAKGAFFIVECRWIESPAYRDLSSTARSLLIEFLNIYRPGRNVSLVISTRQASDRLSVSENTGIKAFHELVEHGFLCLTNHDNWTQRKAREFELTVREMKDNTPKDNWMFWSKENQWQSYLIIKISDIKI